MSESIGRPQFTSAQLQGLHLNAAQIADYEKASQAHDNQKMAAVLHTVLSQVDPAGLRQAAQAAARAPAPPTRTPQATVPNKQEINEIVRMGIDHPEKAIAEIERLTQVFLKAAENL